MIRKLISILILTGVISSPAVAQTYVVQSGDSLWKIASKTKATGVSVHQMIAAIHESNSAALGTDIGNIKPGMELLIPNETMALTAETKDAEKLLVGISSSASSLTRNTRIDSIQKQISRIENEINDTIESMKTSQESFDSMINQ